MNFIEIDNPKIIEASQDYTSYKPINKVSRDGCTFYLILFFTNTLGAFVWNDYQDHFEQEPMDLEPEDIQHYRETYPNIAYSISEWEEDNARIERNQANQ